MSGVWDELRRASPRSVVVGGVELRRGSRVVLHPRPGGDILDLALAGRVAVVEGLDADMDANLHVAVTLEDDPGRDLGEERQPGHRFFFSPEEVEPLADAAPPVRRRILVAGIGNVFFGDDGWGVELARRLADRPLPPEVDVAEFGIRGMDLAYALADYDVAVLLDATPRGQPPGTLYVIDPETDHDAASLDAHGMDPVRVLALARELGPVPERVVVLGCEPATHVDPGDDDVVEELSPPVRAALDEGVRQAELLLAELTTDPQEGASP